MKLLLCEAGGTMEGKEKVKKIECVRLSILPSSSKTHYRDGI